MTVPDTELVNSTITVNNDCGSIDGVTTRVACCGHVARHVTIQVEGSSTVLKIGKILVKVALPRCDTSQVNTNFSSYKLTFVNCISAADLTLQE